MKLIIDIDEELYKNVIDKTRNGYLGSDVWIAVAKGTPYEDRPTEKPGPKADPKSGDLISRSELEKAFEDYEAYSDIFPKTVYDIIDNAPTVDLDESVIQKVLNKRCMTVVTNEYLVALHGKRPQGDLISRETLRERIDDCEYFNSSFQKMTVAEFLTIIYDIINKEAEDGES